MKAKLRDGSVVEVPKECDCMHHDGPHWWYMHLMDMSSLKDGHQRTEDLLMQVSEGVDAVQAYLQSIRGTSLLGVQIYERLLFEMRRRNIVEILGDDQ